MLVLATSYPAHADDPSGHFVRSHALGLARAGADVHVVVPGTEALEPREEAPNELTVHRLGADALFRWPGAAARAREQPLRLFAVAPFALRLRKRLQTIGAFDRIVAHWMVPTALPLLAFAELALGPTRKPELELVAHGADVRLLLGLPGVVRAHLVERLVARASRFTFVARRLHDELCRSLPAALAERVSSRSVIGPCPISVPERKDLADPRLPSLQEHPYAVWVGRDIPAKRLELAIDAALHARVKLVVVGASTSRLRHRPGARGQITFLGARPRTETLAWIAHANVLLSTSSGEGAPTATREARALDVPVIACNAGDLAEWATLDDRIRLVADDPRSIASALRREV